jgi:hypothetical protein
MDSRPESAGCNGSQLSVVPAGGRPMNLICIESVQTFGTGVAARICATGVSTMEVFLNSI